LLVKIGINKFLSRRSRWREECFDHIGWKGGRKLLRLKGVYKRSLWDWFTRSRRVPQSVAEEMLKDGAIEQYIPVQGLDMVLVKCNATIYGVYMDYTPS